MSMMMMMMKALHAASGVAMVGIGLLVLTTNLHGHFADMCALNVRWSLESCKCDRKLLQYWQRKAALLLLSSE